MNFLLEKWLKYVELEALMQTRIDLSEINELQFLALDLNSVSSSGNIAFDVPLNSANLISNKFLHNESSLSKKIVISYPYAVVKQKGKEYIRPLFIFEVNIEEFKVNPNKIVINVFGESGYAPIADFFEQDFKIDRDIFIENISFHRQINKFLEKNEEDFFIAVQNFCKTMDLSKTNKSISDIKYNYCVIHEVDNGFLAKKMKDSLRVLKNINIQASLLDSYLSKKNSTKQFKYNKKYYGKFNNGKVLSYGQEQALKALNSGEKMVAVQGGPGTGKTTLFLSVIASSVTQRAISMIKGRDFNNQMVVVSVANKAIDNVIDEFKKQDFIDNYNDFYFLTGSVEQINTSLDRMQNYLDFLDSAKYNKHEQALIADEILEIVTLIDNNRQKKEQIKTLYEHGINQEQEHQKNINIWAKNQQDLKKIFNTDISDVKESLYQAKLFLDEIDSFFDIQMELYLCEKFFKNIQDVYEYSIIIDNKIRSVPWYYPEKIFNKKSAYLKMFFDRYGDLLSIFGIKEISEPEHFFSEIVNQLHTLFTFHKSLQEKYNINPYFLKSFENIVTVSNMLKFEDKWRESRKFLNQFNKIKEEYIQLHSESNDDRILFTQEQEKLFILSMQYLRLEQIKRKHLVKHALVNMRNILTGNQSRRISKAIYEAGLVNFFKEFSLVYPVLTTTMASSWNLTKDFVYSFELQDNEEKIVDYISGFKPFNLVLSDESGMTKIHEPAPLLYAADSALVVGDTKQLPPIFSIAPNVAEHFELEHFTDTASAEMFSPTIASFYHRAAGCKTSDFDDIGDSLILDEHRRCQPNIANLFIEIGNYSGIQIKTPELSNEDKEKLSKFSDGNDVVYLHTEGKSAGFKHTNIDEINNIEKVLNKLIESGFDVSKNVGIITPYVAQKELLIQRFSALLNHSKNNQKIGTIHSFQGAEFDVVIFSPVIFDNKDSGSFLNAKPNILIVAISRAKMLFVTVCNRDKLISSGGSLLKIISKSEEMYV